jgi:tripartite ATP-independent transporter DctM subunit
MGVIVLLGTLLLTLIAGMPIAFGIGIASLAYILFDGSVSLVIVPQMIANGLDSYNVIAIPFFILAAQIMNRGGVTDRLMQFASTIVGHLKGGLAHVNILTSMLFAGMSGSAVADSAGLGQILIPTMKKKGYGADYSAAVTAASSTIGPIIPPSVPIVIYGILAETSIGQLFLAGAVPGFVMGLLMLVLSYFIAARKGYPQEDKPTASQVGRAVVRVIPAMMTPVIILGGMWTGIFSPTEAAAVAVGYAILQGFAMRDLSLRALWDAIQSATIYSAIIMLIVASANLFGWILSTEQIPVRFTGWLLGITDSKIVVLLILNVFLLIAGCFMEILAIMLMTVPVFMPVVMQLGIDPVHFGVIMVLNLMVGLLSPPFGLSLYIAQDIAQIPYAAAVKAILPFIGVILVLLAVITYVPDFVLFLPRLLMR